MLDQAGLEPEDAEAEALKFAIAASIRGLAATVVAPSGMETAAMR